MSDRPLELPTSEDEARSRVTVADLIQEDLDDPATPSIRAGTRAAAAGGWDYPAQPRRTLQERLDAGDLEGGG